ncbi:hypothetical protein HV079_18145 [Citrobacter freundii]|uniref:hypothetical protein n=1 Tax=Citrobacter freundii TaxID=546 RepID=UPI0015EA900F|nr:hypothetical protein [Citrobacter freundii]QLZ60952.1 hypothetical protein HV079_18145 [Citrobacter freundii]
MSEVKIYTVVSDELSPPVIGESFCTDMVRHSDYAELEQKLTDMAVQLANAESKCRELAAENGGLKKAAEFATADDMWIEQADGMLDYRYCEWYVDVLKAAMETPATDAILAEVRAQESKLVYESILDNPAVTDMESIVDWLEQYANDSVAFSAQLRKGVQS